MRRLFPALPEFSHDRVRLDPFEESAQPWAPAVEPGSSAHEGGLEREQAVSADTQAFTGELDAVEAGK